MDRSDYEDMTVLDLRDQLSARGLVVYGSKAELVDRLVEADEHQTVESPVDEPSHDDHGSEPARVHAGGYVSVTAGVAPAPDPIDTCSVHGAVLVDGVCPRDGHEGHGWTVANPVASHPVVSDRTFWPDETVGPRSAQKD